MTDAHQKVLPFAWLNGRYLDPGIEDRFLVDNEAGMRKRDQAMVALIFILEAVLIVVDMRMFADNPPIAFMRFATRGIYMASLTAILLRIFDRPLRNDWRIQAFLFVSLCLHNAIIATYLHPGVSGVMSSGVVLAVHIFTIAAYYTFLTPRLDVILFAALGVASQYVLLQSWQGPEAHLAYAPFLLFGLIAFFHYTAVALARQQRRTWQETLRARQLQMRAEDTQRFRTRLLELVGHDMRQPLGALHYYSLALRYAAARLPVGTGDDLHRIVGQIDEVDRQVGDILDKALDMAQLDNEAIQARCRVQSVTSLVTDLRRRFAMQQQNAGIRLSFYGERQLLAHDPALMEAVLRNLIDNALRHHAGAARRARVIVAFRSWHGGCIDIIDNGGGLPADLADRMEAGQGTERHGLGLQIAADLAEKQGWQMQLVNRPGSGARFRLTRGSAGSQPVPLFPLVRPLLASMTAPGSTS